MSPTLDALLPSAAAAQAAAQQLLAAGFAEAAVQVATPDTLQAAHVAPPTAADSADAPAGSNSALVSVRVAPGPAADQARQILARHGATDVRHSAPGAGEAAGSGPDLAGDISLLRDANGLDANGLTTH